MLLDALATAELADRDFRAVQSLAYERAGIRIADGKRLLVQHRLARRMRERGLRSYRDYCALLARAEESDEVRLCLNALTTNETFFFRHKQHWDFIAERLIPAWRQAHSRPRAWSAACSTGEEPYSLAILARHSLPERGIEIEATDINDAVLRTAELGVYGPYALQKVSPGCLERYFTPEGEDRFRLVEHAKRLVRFRQANLMMPEHGAAFDLVLLRNVLIYFDDASKARVLANVTARMRPGAWLMIGGAENLGQVARGLAYRGPGTYQRSGDV